MVTTLKAVLQKHWALTQHLDQAAYAGTRRNDRPLDQAQAAQLRQDLSQAIQRNKPLLWILFALIAVLLLATVVTAFPWAGPSTGRGWLSLTSGGILAFLVPAAFRMWREITSLEMMAAVATTVQGEALTALMRLLLEGGRVPTSSRHHGTGAENHALVR